MARPLFFAAVAAACAAWSLHFGWPLLVALNSLAVGMNLQDAIARRKAGPS